MCGRAQPRLSQGSPGWSMRPALPSRAWQGHQPTRAAATASRTPNSLPDGGGAGVGGAPRPWELAVLPRTWGSEEALLGTQVSAGCPAAPRPRV